MAFTDSFHQVKVIAERRQATSNSAYKVRRTTIDVDKLNLRLEGSRAADNLQVATKSRYLGFTSGEGGVRRGDTLSCIIDDVDVTNLVGAWNFYYNLRDESGYNLDGFMRSGDEKYDIQRDDSSRQQGQKYFDCNSNDCSIKLVQHSEEDNQTKLNFRDGCEMHFWIRTPASFSGKEVLFHRMDSDYGIEVGIEKLSNNKYYVFANTRTSRDDGSETKNEYSLYSTASGGGQGNEHSSPDADLEIELAKEYFIRIWRDEDYSISSSDRTCVFKVSVNNKSGYGSYYHERSGDGDEGRWMDHNDGTSIPAYFMSDDSQNNNFSGRVYAVRFYNQALTNRDASKVYDRIMPMNTMKFGGEVSKVDARWNGTLSIQAVGWSKSLLHATIDEDMFSGESFIEGANGSETGLLDKTIQDMITQYNSSKIDSRGTQTASGSNSWVEKLGKDVVYKMKFANEGYSATGYTDEDDAGTPSWKVKTNQYNPRHISKLLPTGTLLTYCRLLAVIGGNEVDSSGTEIHKNGADQFYVLPRKVLIFESSEIPNHCYLGMHDGCIFDHVGNSNANVYNDIHVFGKGKPRTKKVGFNNSIVTQNSVYNVFTGAFSVSGSPSGSEDVSAGVGRRQLLDVHVYIYDEYGQFVKVGRNASNGDYEVDWDSGDVTFKTGNPDELWIHYTYIDYASYSDVDGDHASKDYEYGTYYSSKDATSIKEYGVKSLLVSFPQMEDITTTASISRRILWDTAKEKDEIEIVNPRLAFGQQVGTIMTADCDAVDIHGNDMIIKSIRYSVPENKSYIVVGDHQYDFLDSVEKTEDKVESVRDTSGTYTLVGKT